MKALGGWYVTCKKAKFSGSNNISGPGSKKVFLRFQCNSFALCQVIRHNYLRKVNNSELKRGKTSEVFRPTILVDHFVSGRKWSQRPVQNYWMINYRAQTRSNLTYFASLIIQHTLNGSLQRVKNIHWGTCGFEVFF